MTLVTATARGVSAAGAETSVRWRVVTALARGEARRMLRSPWLLGGAILTALLTRQWLGPQEWNGADYGAWFFLPVGLYVAASLIAAGSFHRARRDMAAGAPSGGTERCLGRLLAATSLIGLTTAFVAGLTAYIWLIDGIDLGTEPGRTLHAHPTLAELSQPLALAVFAVAVGAAVGRRLRHRVTATLVLLVGWFPVTMAFWAFQGRVVNAFSILQSQPVYVDVGPPGTSPSTFPGDWLLEPPNEYRDHWARLVVSEPLAWWHSGWLLGLSALLVASALPSGRLRKAVAAAGALVAVVSVAAQLMVYPS